MLMVSIFDWSARQNIGKPLPCSQGAPNPNFSPFPTPTLPSSLFSFLSSVTPAKLPPRPSLPTRPDLEEGIAEGMNFNSDGGRKKKGDFFQQQSNCFAAAAPAKVVVISFVLLVRGERGR